MALSIRRGFAGVTILVGACLPLLAGLARAERLAPSLSRQPPAASFAPDPGSSTNHVDEPDTWIFSGSLQDSRETFSGTLVTGKTETQFELKLANGATCDGGDLTPSTGLVRLSDITCSDARVLKALFVPQGGEALKVFGHVGDERFVTVAHLLGPDAPAEKPQTTAPHAPPSPGPVEPPRSPRPAPG